MKTVLPLMLSAILAVPAFAADSYTIDPRHTLPVFEINHLGFSTQRGRFNKATGKVILDHSARNGALQVNIDTASIDMGLEDWDKHMKGEDFFNVEKYPVMTYIADRLVFEGDKPVAAEGWLTLLGVTRPVRLAIATFNCGIHPLNRKALCGADISTSIRRSDFGMTKYVPAVSDEVRISIPVEAFRD